MRVSELTPDLAKRLDLPGRPRVVLMQRIAGIAARDVIEEIDQQPVTSVNELTKSWPALDPDSTPRVFHVPPIALPHSFGATALGGSGARKWRERIRIPL